MPDLREQLQDCFEGRVCLMGLGNVDYGDDGFGVRLAEKLVEEGVTDVIVAGTTPDRCLGKVVKEEFDHLVFLDAVDFGETTGSVILLNAEDIVARYPQVSTHHISVGLLAKWVEANGSMRAWLLGVQPESLKPAKTLTPQVQTTLDALNHLLCTLKTTTAHQAVGAK